MNQILTLAWYHTRSARVAFFIQPNSKLIKQNFLFFFLHQIHTDHVLRIIGVDAPHSLAVAHKGPIISPQHDILETLQHGKIPPLTRTLALLLYTLAKRLRRSRSLK